MASAALISQMDPPPGEQEAFDEWYRSEHIPLRMGLPGFRGAVRAWAVEGAPAHLVLYYADGLGTFETPEYDEIKKNQSARTQHMLGHVAAFTRFVGEELSDSGESEEGRYLYLVSFAVPSAYWDEFDAWYVQEHVPLLMRNDHWLRCRRYRVVSGDPPDVTRLAVHELSDLSVLSSKEREEARSTEWRSRLAQRDYFASVRYAVYERSEAFSAGVNSELV